MLGRLGERGGEEGKVRWERNRVGDERWLDLRLRVDDDDGVYERRLPAVGVDVEVGDEVVDVPLISCLLPLLHQPRPNPHADYSLERFLRSPPNLQPDFRLLPPPLQQQKPIDASSSLLLLRPPARKLPSSSYPPSVEEP